VGKHQYEKAAFSPTKAGLTSVMVWAHPYEDIEESSSEVRGGGRNKLREFSNLPASAFTERAEKLNMKGISLEVKRGRPPCHY